MTPNRTENKQINFRVTEEEYQRIKIMADNMGMSVSAFCKSKAKGSRMKSPLIDREGALKFASELRKIGVNVNQIAKHINSDKSLSKGRLNALEGIREELNKLWQLFNSALQK